MISETCVKQDGVIESCEIERELLEQDIEFLRKCYRRDVDSCIGDDEYELAHLSVHSRELQRLQGILSRL